MDNSKKIIEALGMESAPGETQNRIVQNVTSVIDRRLMLMVDELLTDEQRTEFEKVQSSQGDVEARLWLEKNVVNTQELYTALLEDYLKERSARQKKA